ncbi:lipase family protein [Candidatus Odyssella thessalonicensis]|uniref:lipase family protein n=1 Tax=Candidatus Odyssella thessalonicensis TaxID=84647 RepID=UPI000225A8C0|nr:hypothetical protein [Candidatus Odyssella thessalonicensis]
MYKSALNKILAAISIIQTSWSGQTALELLTADDIHHSSTLVHKVFCHNYASGAKIIEDPITHENIGQVSFDGQQIDIAFRATLSNPTEFLSNLNFSFDPLDSFGFKEEQSLGHKGFSEAAQRVQELVLNQIAMYQAQAHVQQADARVIFHGQSRGAALSSLIAFNMKMQQPDTRVYVLNYAPLPFLNEWAKEEYNRRLQLANHLNFICEEDGVVDLVEKRFGHQFYRGGTDIRFSAAQQEDFKERIGKYTHFQGGVLGAMGLALFGITAEKWEGHMPETYFHSAEALQQYKAHLAS